MVNPQQQLLFKGEQMEELLRNYFLSSGYYVVRAASFKYSTEEVTDVDLFLYGRSSSILRQRINVDIKNKKIAKSFERILWANGLQKLLHFDACIVATPDKRLTLSSFGQEYGTIVLDGTFLKKLPLNPAVENLLKERVNEETLLKELSLHRDTTGTGNKDWKYIYEKSKSQLLTQQDYSGFNFLLPYIKYFFEKAITDVQNRQISMRVGYILLSHLLIIGDFIVKDIAFLEQSEREKRLLEGFQFGNLGKGGVDSIISIASQLSGNTSKSSLYRILDSPQLNILREFFSNTENGKHLFIWAKSFEHLGFSRVFVNPNDLDAPLRGVISVLLDFFQIERRKFFNSFDLPEVEVKSNSFIYKK